MKYGPYRNGNLLVSGVKLAARFTRAQEEASLLVLGCFVTRPRGAVKDDQRAIDH